MIRFQLLLAGLILKFLNPILEKLIRVKPLIEFIQRRAIQVTNRYTQTELTDSASVISNTVESYIRMESYVANKTIMVEKVPMDAVSKMPSFSLLEVAPANITLDTLSVHLDYLFLKTNTPEARRLHSYYFLIGSIVPRDLINHYRDQFLRTYCELNPNISPILLTDYLKQRPMIWLLPFIQSVWRRLLAERS
jgi:hypothetical protein